MAIENIRIGTKSGSVRTLVIESLLFLEIVMEAVIEEIKTILKRERAFRGTILHQRSSIPSLVERQQLELCSHT